MQKLDLSKTYKTYYNAKTKPEIIEISPAQFLSITGKGDPSGAAFAEKIQALYTTAYTIKFLFKQKDLDFTVPKLECLWWYDEAKFLGISMEEAPIKIARSEWEYRLLIRMPDFVSAVEANKGITLAFEKKNIPLINELEFYKMQEGKCVQVLHIGPFSTEAETLAKMNQLIKSEKLARNGLHHEIYLSDINKTAPEKLKTILREPVK